MDGLVFYPDEIAEIRQQAKQEMFIEMVRLMWETGLGLNLYGKPDMNFKRVHNEAVWWLIGCAIAVEREMSGKS